MESLGKKKQQLTIAVSAALATLSYGAVAGDCYVGAGVGWSHSGLSGSKVASDATSVLSNAGFTFVNGGSGLAGSVTDDSDTGYKFFGGCQINSNFAIEGQVLHVGTAKGKFSGTVDGPEGASGTSIYDSRLGLGLGVVGTLPIGNGFSALAKVGALYSRSEVKTSAVVASFSPVTVNHIDKDSSTNGYYGAGIKYSLDPNASVRLEWERYRINSSNWDLVSASFVIGF